MAKAKTGTRTNTRLVKAAERVGRTLGKGARRVDTMTATAKKLAAVVRTRASKKAVKAVKKAVKKAKPALTKASRDLATVTALAAKHTTIVDERAIARATAGRRWAARKPR